MITTNHATEYNKEEMTRTVQQTVTYTKADDLRTLAQAQMSLANLYAALSNAVHPSIVTQVQEQIAEKQAEVDMLQDIVDGYDA